jgi:hypothetical protein
VIMLLPEKYEGKGGKKEREREAQLVTHQSKSSRHNIQFTTAKRAIP